MQCLDSNSKIKQTCFIAHIFDEYISSPVGQNIGNFALKRLYLSQNIFIEHLL